MFQKAWAKIIATSIRIRRSIAFLPSIITIFAFLLGIFLISFRSIEIESFIIDIPFIKIHSISTLRTILTAFLTGIISIAIFSFSMVMVVLNQAATHYSPKILNWLVSKKSNQYILGIYLGTIVFTLILLLQLPKDSDLKPLYHLAVFLDAGLTFYCLTLFVSFINNASSDIQISNILEKIYKQTKRKLKEEKENTRDDIFENETDIVWNDYPTEISGYLQTISKDSLVKILSENGLKIKIVQSFGFYYIKGTPIYSLNKKVKDEELHKKIMSAFIFYPGERLQDHTFYGFRQLSEIAVKALSPGINDPGTAYTCIDYLTDLFSIKMGKDKPNIICDKDDQPRIFIHTHTFSELLGICMAPILQYGSRDVQILENLMQFLHKLSYKDSSHTYRKTLNTFLRGIEVEIENHKSNAYFYDQLRRNKQMLKNVPGGYFNL